MNILAFHGFAGGTDLEYNAGTATGYDSSPARNALSAHIAATTSGTKAFQIRRLSSNGTQGTDFAVSTVFTQFYFQYATKPAANSEPIVEFFTSASSSNGHVRITSAGTLAIYDSTGTLIATGATVLAANTWYRIGIQIEASATGAWAVRINGSTEISSATSGTANLGSTTARINYGKTTNKNSQSVDYHYSDIIVADDWPTSLAVMAMYATGAGTYTDGTGSYTDVDEAPSDGDTTYWTSSTATEAFSVALATAATAGITCTPLAVKIVAVARDEGDVSSIKARLRSSNINSDTTASDPGSSYVARAISSATNPKTSAPWTLSDLDTLEAGIYNNASVAVRCTQLYGYVVVQTPEITLATGSVNIATTAGGNPPNTLAVFDGIAVSETHSANVTASVTISDASKVDVDSLPAGWSGSGGSYSCTSRTTSQLVTDLTAMNFTGAAVGISTITLTVTTADATDSTSAVVTASIVAPDLSVIIASGGTYDFGELASGESSSQQFTLNNTGTADLVLGTVTITGSAGFDIDAGDDPSDDTIAAGSSGTVTVDALFSTDGNKTGQLSIPSNDADSPYIINLSATTLGDLPADPSGLAVTTSGYSATLTWTDNADNETGFKVYADVNGEGAGPYDTIAVPDLETKTYTNVDPGIYAFYLKAYNDDGESGATSTVYVAVVNLSVSGNPTTGFTLSFVGAGYPSAFYEFQISANCVDWTLVADDFEDVAQGTPITQVIKTGANVFAAELESPIPLSASMYFRLRYYIGATELGYSGIASSVGTTSGVRRRIPFAFRGRR